MQFTGVKAYAHRGIFSLIPRGGRHVRFSLGGRLESYFRREGVHVPHVAVQSLTAQGHLGKAVVGLTTSHKAMVRVGP